MRAKNTIFSRRLPRAFYAKPAETLAEELIGKILVRRFEHAAGEATELRARIVETEAYVGEHDLACHASKGRTGRTQIMFGPAGFAYVYLIYGIHDMFNIVAASIGDAQAVLIRGAAALGDFQADLSGPGKLARAMKITRDLNGIDLTGDQLFLVDDAFVAERILRTPRIGVDYSGLWKEAMLRFIDADRVKK